MLALTLAAALTPGAPIPPLKARPAGDFASLTVEQAQLLAGKVIRVRARIDYAEPEYAEAENDETTTSGAAPGAGGPGRRGHGCRRRGPAPGLRRLGVHPQRRVRTALLPHPA